MMGSLSELSPLEKNEQRIEKAAAEHQKRVEQVARLAKNPDFKAFVGWMLEDSCAFDFGTMELNAFTQGKRAAASRLMNLLSITREGRELCGELAYKHHTQKED